MRPANPLLQCKPGDFVPDRGLVVAVVKEKVPRAGEMTRILFLAPGPRLRKVLVG
jgi:hypothetical protein